MLTADQLQTAPPCSAATERHHPSLAHSQGSRPLPEAVAYSSRDKVTLGQDEAAAEWRKWVLQAPLQLLATRREVRELAVGVIG